MTISSHSAALATSPAQSLNGLCRKDRKGRRNVGIAGPVFEVFSQTCKALKKNQQDVATEVIHRWNQRHARRAKAALELAAARLNPEKT